MKLLHNLMVLRPVGERKEGLCINVLPRFLSVIEFVSEKKISEVTMKVIELEFLEALFILLPAVYFGEYPHLGNKRIKDKVVFLPI